MQVKGYLFKKDAIYEVYENIKIDLKNNNQKSVEVSDLEDPLYLDLDQNIMPSKENLEKMQEIIELHSYIDDNNTFNLVKSMLVLISYDDSKWTKTIKESPQENHLNIA